MKPQSAAFAPGAAMERDNGYTLSVTQLNEYVAGLFRRDLLLQGVRVRGEVSGFKKHSSGHLYFSIKDEGALVRCVMFRQNALSLSTLPKDGQSVVVRGSVSLYTRDGQYQFYVTGLEQQGEGELYRRFLELKAALEARGLFDQAHKKPLPLLPKCVGVITSPTGAVIQDISHVVRRRFPKMNMLLYPVRVQGEGAAEEISHAIREMSRRKLADVLIVGRGGGSLEDLWAFNEAVVAQAIYDCEIPIVSAVGHETDFSIADFVADLRAPTPSAAAELCVPEYDRLLGEIEGAAQALRTLSRGRVAALRQEVEAASHAASFALPKHRVEVLRRDLAGARISLKASLRAELLGAYGALEQTRARLEEMSPRRVLDRGYAMVKLATGYVSGIGELAPGMGADLVMRDGTAEIMIEKINKDKTGKTGNIDKADKIEAEG